MRSLFLQIGGFICGASLLAASNGCSFTYVDSRGATHVLGLVKLTIEPPWNREELGAESVQIRSVGISVYSTPLHTGVVIGYNHETLTAVHNNAAVFTREPKGGSRPAGDRGWAWCDDSSC
ncbi:MAG: hypothetical protein HYV08_18085 [Deltaproteobacteria bacterium]|nr:hypothetical protein [Deltaproteobacteria bacterium]MBI3079689.1 hypothetical protein [Deltaproteobacteria bacterium]